ncbi:hypothetical protein L6V77_28360 [Myxococcota bacterium]|nr:hypothetical protein [Myxococcota bacterium]
MYATSAGNFAGPIELIYREVGQQQVSATSRYAFVVPPNQDQGCNVLGNASCNALQGRCAGIDDLFVRVPGFDGGSVDVTVRVQFGDQGTDARDLKTVRLSPAAGESATILFWIIDRDAHGDFVPVIFENARVVDGTDSVCGGA